MLGGTLFSALTAKEVGKDSGGRIDEGGGGSVLFSFFFLFFFSAAKEDEEPGSGSDEDVAECERAPIVIPLAERPRGLFLRFGGSSAAADGIEEEEEDYHEEEANAEEDSDKNG